MVILAATLHGVLANFPESDKATLAGLRQRIVAVAGSQVVAAARRMPAQYIAGRAAIMSTIVGRAAPPQRGADQAPTPPRRSRS